MHLRRVAIENIKSMASLVWERKQTAGWHVILGGNGSGKTTLLRAIAVALNGAREIAALRPDFNTWLREGVDEGRISVSVDDHRPWDVYSGGGKRRSEPLRASVMLTRNNGRVEIQAGKNNNASRHLWGSGSGWFSASYGPFRRFEGGDKELEKLYYSYPKISRHLTLFGENIALSECTAWLEKLRFLQLEKRSSGMADGGDASRILSRLTRFINTSGLLPHDAVMREVTANGVIFTDANGAKVSVAELSDGYRSVLSMTFEIIRQLHSVYQADDIFDDQLRVRPPGIVMIDEVDVHLHPSWQRRIGAWFMDRLPNFQFIVTTHSPLICHAAEHGSIFRLPEPGSDERARFIEGVERQRLIYGNVLDAYATDGFGHVPTRSAAGVERLERLAELNQKALDEGLQPDEQAERIELERIFASG